jgi:hypothetical protein
VALDLIESRYLSNPHAADGDLRHAASALRFYQEFGRAIPAPRLRAAMRRLLDRPEFAAAVIADLARWQDWDALPQIASLYTQEPAPSTATRRAIVGYLLVCPSPAAARELERLRQFDPDGVRRYERSLLLFGTDGK